MLLLVSPDGGLRSPDLPSQIKIVQECDDVGSQLEGRSMSSKEFYVVIEKDENGLYVGEVPQLKACYSQGETIDELINNIREVIEMCLEEIAGDITTEFVAVCLPHQH